MRRWTLLDLTLSRRRPLSYRNQLTDLQSKSMDWFLYDNGLHHKRVKGFGKYLETCTGTTPSRDLFSFPPTYFNLFVRNASFSTPWKHLKTVRFSDVFKENCKVFSCFQGVEKGCIGNKWFNMIGFTHKKKINQIFRHKKAASLLEILISRENIFWKLEAEIHFNIDTS